MRTNKKGFTLIELLAVIVILAIIALITVPVVINIINNAKKGAAEDSTYGVIESAKLFWVSNQMDFEANNTTLVFKCTTTCVVDSSSTATLSDGTTANPIIGQSLDISGTRPSNPEGDKGTITITTNGVTVKNLKFGDYYCSTGANSEKVSCGTSKVS